MREINLPAPGTEILIGLVRFSEEENKWCAFLEEPCSICRTTNQKHRQHKRKMYWLGYFDTKEEAEQAREKYWSLEEAEKK